MFSFLNRIGKHWAQSLTIMVIPHGTARRRQLSFSLPFFLFMVAFWTGFTAWAGYMASEHFDYWRVKANAHIMKLKLDYFANQLHRSREMMDEVKEMDAQLRALLNMGGKDAIIQASDATGGPTQGDASALQGRLEGRLAEMSLPDISHQFTLLREETQRRIDSFRQIAKRIDYEQRLYRCTPNILPVDGHLTSRYGLRASPLHGNQEIHRGVDVAADAGTPVRATANGLVLLAGWAGGYGKVVVIDHGFGYSTRYAHHRQVLVRRGDRVKRGQIIGLVGSTGNATGPHSHYEVWHRGRTINPEKTLKTTGL